MSILETQLSNQLKNLLSILWSTSSTPLNVQRFLWAPILHITQRGLPTSCCPFLLYQLWRSLISKPCLDPITLATFPAPYPQPYTWYQRTWKLFHLPIRKPLWFGATLFSQIQKQSKNRARDKNVTTKTKHAFLVLPSRTSSSTLLNKALLALLLWVKWHGW